MLHTTEDYNVDAAYGRLVFQGTTVLTLHTDVLCFRGLRSWHCIQMFVSGDYSAYAAYKRLCFQETTVLTLHTNICFRELRCLRCRCLCVQGNTVLMLHTNVCVFRVAYYSVYVAYKCLCFQGTTVLCCIHLRFQGTTVFKRSTRCLSGRSTQATKAAPSPESSTPTTYVI